MIVSNVAVTTLLSLSSLIWSPLTTPDSQVCRDILQSVKFCWQKGYGFDSIWHIQRCWQNAGRIIAIFGNKIWWRIDDHLLISSGCWHIYYYMHIQSLMQIGETRAESAFHRVCLVSVIDLLSSYVNRQLIDKIYEFMRMLTHQQFRLNLLPICCHTANSLLTGYYYRHYYYYYYYSYC